MPSLLNITFSAHYIFDDLPTPHLHHTSSFGFPRVPVTCYYWPSYTAFLSVLSVHSILTHGHKMIVRHAAAGQQPSLNSKLSKPSTILTSVFFI